MYGRIHVCLMVFNATFTNISVISWGSVLLVEETGEPGENHWPVASHWETLSHNVVHLALIEIQTHNISGDCIGSCKSNYHMITTTMALYAYCIFKMLPNNDTYWVRLCYRYLTLISTIYMLYHGHQFQW